MLKPVSVKPLPGYKLQLKFADGVEGVVDLSDSAGKGVFRIWSDPKVFEDVSISASGAVHWNDQVELCADALYMEITGKPPEDVFPNLKRAGVDA